MTTACLAIIIALILLEAYSLWLLSSFARKFFFVEKLAISGALGLALISILLTAIIQANIRVGFIFFLLLGGVALALALFRSKRPVETEKTPPILGDLDSSDSRSSFISLITTFGTVFAVYFLPLWAGGLSFHILRGNGTDTFNYVTMAFALQKLPLSALLSGDIQQLINQHPSLGLAHFLLRDRWTASAVLAWFSEISQVNVVLLPFALGSLGLILSSGPLFLFAQRVGLNNRYAIFLAVAILVGFWAQIILDMQPLAHLLTMPICILVIFLTDKTQGKNSGGWMRNGRLLLALTSCSLTLLYVEMMPFLLLGIILHQIWLLWFRRFKLSQAFFNTLPFFTGIALAFCLSPTLLSFLINQLRYGATISNNWDQAYFSWLYINPTAALWGLTHIDLGRVGLHSPSSLPLRLLTGFWGLILTILALIFFRQVHRERGSSPARNLLASLLIAGFLQAFLLLIRQQWWAAGKAISYLYPFLWLSAGWIIYSFKNFQGWKDWLWMRRWIWMVGFSWIMIEVFFGIARIGIAAAGKDYKDYISHHGFYRAYDWDLRPITKTIPNAHSEPIVLFIPEDWLREYVYLFLNGNQSIIVGNECRDRMNNPLKSPLKVLPSRYILLERNSIIKTIPDWGAQLVPMTRNLALVDIDRQADAKPLIIIESPGIRKNNFPVQRPIQNSIFWIASSKRGTLIFPKDGYEKPVIIERGLNRLDFQTISLSHSQCIEHAGDTGMHTLFDSARWIPELRKNFKNDLTH